ncbi:efflux RND transporter permease subunit [Sphingobacterium pedocola]|uniref:Cation transporter n=1 Tax=Sphingobacterium pedocola TaxID=2082722 RepID=A0ABR9TAF0_9SPHI|nr:efflux RND transporter permease subunit [Sphingobacterium pedocola]MBE8722342.1 cation transporter [Sphingobacterium pedocola]
MIRYLIDRPIAVFMAFLAFFILGIITYLHIPISLLPNIPIPEITIQISGKNASARGLENTVVAPIRQQLLQVAHIRDIHSETHDGQGIIRLNFEYGANTDLAFIEVNEKIDAAMNRIHRDMERPRVIKASATDIPVLHLNLTLNTDSPFADDQEQKFLELSELANTVIKKRIEQLPQVAMVDITGLMDKQILISPVQSLLEITGITPAEIATVLQDNNIEPGAMLVKEGHYAYNISFSSVVRTLADVQQLYIRKNDRIFQLQDIADIQIVPQQEKGMALYNGKRAVNMAIIKQGEENMASMQAALEGTINSLKRTYPDIAFSTSQNQTELLDYTIANLQQNLILAFIFVSLVSVFFMRDARSPLIIGISMFVSLIVCLLFFYLCNISLNIVSLTGLVLALGMMIDNSIIVTDNISQYRKQGLPIDDSCIKGTNEVIAPMLSSSFTTIAVFIPLIFMSGIAGAIFFDQAFSVTVGLLVSYLTGIMLLPVLYKLIYKMRLPVSLSKWFKPSEVPQKVSKVPIPERIYHKVADWVFANKGVTTALTLLLFPLCVWMFYLIPKEKMPEISQHELVTDIEWNENIHLEENRKRSIALLDAIRDQVEVSSVLIGQQQFLLNRERENTVSESEIYLKASSEDGVAELQTAVDQYLKQQFPKAIAGFAPAGTIFERVFTTAEADLRLEYYPRNQSKMITRDAIATWQSEINRIAGYVPQSVSFQKQLDIQIDNEKLLVYNVPYNTVYQSLKAGFKEEEITTLRSFQQYLPIMLGTEHDAVNNVIQNSLLHLPAVKNGEQARKVPLQEFIHVVPSEGMKSIVAGRNGEYIPFELYGVTDPEMTLQQLKGNIASDNERDIVFSGSFFSNQKMLDELLLILLVSIMLMYFILTAQFESFVQPLIVLLEIPIAIAAALGSLLFLGYSLNLMSAIGIIVTSGIIINDSILKLDIMNQLRRQGTDLMEAIHEAGRRRLNAILMTSLTSIVCMLPLLFSNDMGSELEKPLAVATIAGMLVGTPISLFVVPLVYWFIYRTKSVKS